MKGVHKVKCKNGHNDKKCETCGIRSKDFECCMEYTGVIDDLIENKCLFYNSNYQKILIKFKKDIY